ERILGFRPETLIGTNGFDGVHPEDRERVAAIYRDMAQRPGSRAIAAYRSRHLDGSWRRVGSIPTQRLAEPRPAGIIINSRDITERIEAQTTYRSLIDNSLQGLLILQDMRIAFANPRFAQITGCTVEELISFTPDQLRALIHHNDQESAWPRA